MSELRLSPSRLGDFMNCPQLYKYRVIDRLPEPLSLDAERGTEKPFNLGFEESPIFAHHEPVDKR